MRTLFVISALTLILGSTAVAADPIEPPSEKYLNFENVDFHVEKILLEYGSEIGVEGTFYELKTRDENGNRVHEVGCLESQQTCYTFTIGDVNPDQIALTGYSTSGDQIFYTVGTSYTHTKYTLRGVITIFD